MSLFRVSQFEPRTLMRVPSPRDPAVTEYVRTLMRALIDSKKAGNQKQIAARMGVSPAYLSTLWKTGVGGRSINAFAKILNFADADALRHAAYDWYRTSGRADAVRLDEPSVQEALSELREMYSWVSDDQWAMMVSRFAHSAFEGRGKDFWVQTLTREVWEDKQREIDVGGERRIAARVEYAQIKGQRGAEKKVRDGFRSKAQAKRAARDAAPAAEPIKLLLPKRATSA